MILTRNDLLKALTVAFYGYQKPFHCCILRVQGHIKKHFMLYCILTTIATQYEWFYVCIFVLDSIVSFIYINFHAIEKGLQLYCFIENASSKPAVGGNAVVILLALFYIVLSYSTRAVGGSTLYDQSIMT